jgi:hypothetical protein
MILRTAGGFAEAFLGEASLAWGVCLAGSELRQKRRQAAALHMECGAIEIELVCGRLRWIRDFGYGGG